MNVMRTIKYSSTIMKGERKLCECHTRFFFIIIQRTLFRYFCFQVNSSSYSLFIVAPSAVKKEKKTEKKLQALDQAGIFFFLNKICQNIKTEVSFEISKLLALIPFRDGKFINFNMLKSKY